jgi:BirA family biotin operon repressor/biotin-[acetyl-CoA-carboxylase] ligase
VRDTASPEALPQAPAGGIAPGLLTVFDQLPSTNDLCTEQARAGHPDGLAILARTQTAGRGTRGRSWSSAGGNLHLSVLIRPAALASGWSLLAGLAVIEALSTFVPDPARLQLKWPNDVTLDGAKLAGILIEAALDWLVIGIGANLANAPSLQDRPTACLAQLAPSPDPVELAHAILERLAYWRSQPFASVRTSWLTRAHPIGAPLLVTAPNISRHGTFAGLAPSGALLLRHAGRIEQVIAAEVQAS